MTSLNIRPDDMGLQSLKRADSPASAAPAPLSASRPAAAVHSEAQTPQPPVKQARQERRKGERRKRNLPVLLDTRGQRDRRRTTDDGAEAGPAAIDVYA
ncbi:MAG: hypothetical protein WCC36_16070 [Gammaproteobacteria bacterium]